MKMNPIQVAKNGFILRAVMCPKCNSRIIHPKDEQEYLNFMNLKNKEFDVKLRFVGNSYAISIPKEIVNFMREQERMMDDMVRLCFEEFGRLSINFSTNNTGNGLNNGLNNHSTIKISENLTKEKKNE